MAQFQKLPLVLSVKATNWRMTDDTSADADAEFKHVRNKALERDQKTCRFCGFRHAKYQEVHHLDDNHHNNELSNLVTACPFCHSVQHIGLAGKFKWATLAWIPEIPQDALHHLCRTIFVVNRWHEEPVVGKAAAAVRNAVSHKNTTLAVESAKALEAKLLSRQAEAERLFKTNDPGELGDVLLEISRSKEFPEFYARRGEFLKGLRLLPLAVRKQGGKDVMPDMVDSWRAAGGPYANLNPTSWTSILNQYKL